MIVKQHGAHTRRGQLRLLSNHPSLPYLCGMIVLPPLNEMVMLNGEVTPETIDAFLADFELKLRAKPDTLFIWICSQGERVEQAIRAYNRIRRSRVRVVTYNALSVASAANVVYCAGHQRCKKAGARFFFHAMTTRWHNGKPSRPYTLDDLLNLNNAVRRNRISEQDRLSVEQDLQKPSGDALMEELRRSIRKHRRQRRRFIDIVSGTGLSRTRIEELMSDTELKALTEADEQLYVNAECSLPPPPLL